MAVAEAYTKRRSRMRRQDNGRRVFLKPRDLEIFQLLDRYRYLDSYTIHAFVGGQLNRTIERLGHLYHEGGYLHRPEQQWDYYNARYMPVIYENTPKAFKLLAERQLLGPQTTWLLRGRTAQHIQFAHSLMICDILASIELGMKDYPNLRFIGWQEILKKAPKETQELQNPFAIPTYISWQFGKNTEAMQTHIVPDAMFGIEYTNGTSKGYRWFALEADRNTMPVYRSSFAETSFLKKMLSYRYIRSHEIFKKHFGISNLMILTVTTHKEHMEAIMEMVQEISEGSKMYAFKAMPSLGDIGRAPTPTSDMLTVPWKRAGHPDFFMDKE